MDWWCTGILTFECLTGVTPFVCEDQMESYRRIIKCQIKYPKSFSKGACEYLDRLLVADPKKRLGCLKGGPADVKKLSWFDGLDWKAQYDKTLPAPHVPSIKSATDDSNFDEVRVRVRVRVQVRVRVRWMTPTSTRRASV